MTPPPTLTELIDSIRSDAPDDDPLTQLTTAAELVAAMSDVSDSALGFFVDQCRRNGRSWSEISAALGVTKQAAHKRFNASEPTTELFTSRARAALLAARGEASALGHNYIGTEHLLLGLFDPKRGIANQVLSELNITRKAVCERVAARVPPFPGAVVGSGAPFTPRATQCLTRATSEARAMGHHYVGTEHLLLAVVADDEGLAASVLAELGVTHDAVRATVIKHLSGFDN
jgi:hypothetical protein